MDEQWNLDINCVTKLFKRIQTHMNAPSHTRAYTHLLNKRQQINDSYCFSAYAGNHATSFTSNTHNTLAACFALHPSYICLERKVFAKQKLSKYLDQKVSTISFQQHLFFILLFFFSLFLFFFFFNTIPSIYPSFILASPYAPFKCIH